VRGFNRNAQAPIGEQGHAAGLCVLVVDDHAESAASLADLLALMGHAVRTAHDGADALEQAAALQPDVVLLDIGLPKGNGYSVARGIRAQAWGGDAVLIAMTGWGENVDGERSTQAGFDLHFLKPVDPNALLDALAMLSPRQRVGRRLQREETQADGQGKP
jgi:CheY-like chemotaxis protein